MRITLLNLYYPPDEAATAQLLGDLGRALSEAGHEVRAVCGDRSYADPSLRYARTSVIDGVAVSRVRSTPFGRASIIGRVIDYATFVAGATIKLLFGPKPDVVISLTTPPMIALVGSAVARLRGARSIFWSMDVYPDVAYELGALRRTSVAGRVFGVLSRITLRMADLVVALGEVMAARLTSAGARAVAVVHNWADEDAIVPRRRRREANEPFLVLYSGNLGLAHEFDTILAAAVRMQADGFPIRFLFTGGGPRVREVAEAVERLALRNVEIRPYVAREQLGESLTACDLHLLTLRDRMPGLLVPSKIYGILAAGKPALYIGPPEGEVHQILTEGRCGTRVGVGDVDAAVAALRRYANDPEALHAEGGRAREMFEARFTRRIALERFIEAVQKLRERH
jgi:glycosyltransferase involved in cell wall biosynthesis